MNIFTDASLNDDKKVAGIGCLVVNSAREKVFDRRFSLSTNNVHIAELCALACATKLALSLGSSSVRIVSDSASAINTLYQYVTYSKFFPRLTKNQKKFFQKIAHSPKQKLILEEMVLMFMRSSQNFSFVHTSGHQKHPAPGTDGYWNECVDVVAGEARSEAEKNVDNVPEIPDIKATFPNTSVKGHWTERISVKSVSTQQKQSKEKKREEVRKEREKDYSTFHVRIAGPVQLNIDSKGAVQLRIVSKHNARCGQTLSMQSRRTR